MFLGVMEEETEDEMDKLGSGGEVGPEDDVRKRSGEPFHGRH